MTSAPTPRTDRRRPRRRRRRGARVVRALVLLLLLGAAFAAGLAVGRVLDDAPADGSRTYVRTLRPVPLPAEPATVTVTVAATGP